MSTEAASPGSPRSPRSAARARLKQKHEDEPWKKQYDLAVKQSLGLRLATPQAAASTRRNPFSSPRRTLDEDDSDDDPNHKHNFSDQQQMDDLLAPSFEAPGNFIESTSSADDSIIRRVEEEIAAARKAASGMTRKLKSPKRSNMPTLLHLPGGAAETIIHPCSSEDSSKHRALELMIQDEFQQDDPDGTAALHNTESHTTTTTATLNETQGSANAGMHIEVVYGQQQQQQQQHDDTTTPRQKPRYPSPEQLYFTDEEWQMETSSPSDEAQSVQNQQHEPNSTLTVEAATEINNNNNSSSNVNNSKSFDKDTNEFDTSFCALDKKKSQEHGNSPLNSNNNGSNMPVTTEDRQEEQPISKSASSSNQDQVTPNGSPSNSSSKRDSPASSVVARNKEPEGVYSLPKEVISTPSNMNGTRTGKQTEMANPSFVERAISHSLSAASRSSQQKTRELLDSLREQREAIVTPKRRGGESSPHIPSSPRSPAAMTRATRARERVKTATRTTRTAPLQSEAPENLDTSMDSQQQKPSTQRSPSPRIPSSRTQSPRWAVYSSSPRSNILQTNTDTESVMSDLNDPKRANRIRFRNPFPVIKNPNTRRDAATIAHDHSVGVQDMPIRWVKPKQELKQLIVAAMGTSLPRRSNACGALKVLTQQPKNQLALVRTDGFLSALIFAASQSLVDIDRDLAIDARTRAVNCLKNVASPKDNRVLMMNHPGVLECLVKVIKTDGNEGRALATATVALLAKTPVCREGLAQVDGLINVISKVLHGESSFPPEEPQPLSDSPAVRRKLNDSVSDFSTQSGSNTDENENPENMIEEEYEAEQQQFKKDPSVAESESSDEEESDDEGGDDFEDDDYLTQPPPVEISHKKASPQLDSIRNKLEVRHQEFVYQARANACAILLHLSRQCTISPQLCNAQEVLASLSSVSREVTLPIHSKCIEILCNLSRFPHNNIVITNYDGMVDLLVAASSSAPAENRLNALRTLQNLSADPPSKRYLATTQVLNLMTSCAMRKDAKEKEVAVATIYNITTEPSAVTAITNTKNVVATLVHLAHSPESSSSIRLLACEALATISLWLQTLAGTGSIPDGVSSVPLPSQKTSGWERWD